MIIVATDEGLDASRLLHPDLHRILSGPLGSLFYAGVPSSQTLVTFSAGDDALFEHVIRRTEHDRSTSPITPTPFWSLLAA